MTDPLGAALGHLVTRPRDRLCSPKSVALGLMGGCDSLSECLPNLAGC